MTAKFSCHESFMQ